MTKIVVPRGEEEIWPPRTMGSSGACVCWSLWLPLLGDAWERKALLDCLWEEKR